MHEWIDVVAACVSLVFLVFVLVALTKWKRHCCILRQKPDNEVFGNAVSSARPLFKWEDNPSLITDAVENGWSRFGFTALKFSSSTKWSLFGMFAAIGDHLKESEPEITWEVCQGSADFMQKIHFNSVLKRKFSNSQNQKKNRMKVQSPSVPSIVRTALPLPGPRLGHNISAFPQEAYFEIRILYACRNDDHDMSFVSNDLGELTMLIRESKTKNANKESSVNVEELKLAISRDDDSNTRIDPGKFEGFVMLSLGLTTGGSVPLKLPGSYQGSFGFNSNGSLYLDGKKLVTESEKSQWARTNRIIGCGFDPRQKRVFFTVDAELVHEINCKSEEFGTPLYPTIAAQGDITILVNFGQTMFSYAPANVHRTPNPCFIGPVIKSQSLGYEDSKELFSMGRIDSQWLNRSSIATKYGYNINNSNSLRAGDAGEESEADLFEIVLDSSSTRRSPNCVVVTKIDET